MTARDLAGALVAGAAVLVMALALALLVGCGPDKGSSGFDESCKVRGGTPTTIKRDGSTVRICQAPAGGWQ